MAGIFLFRHKYTFLLGIVLCATLNVSSQYSIKLFVTTPANHCSDTLYLSGNFNNWSPKLADYQLVKGDDGYFIEIKNLAPGSYESKFTRGSWNTVETNQDGSSLANRVLQLTSDTSLNVSIAGWSDDFAAPEKRRTASANVTLMDSAFAMPELGCTRKIWLYLPPGYKNSNKRYPVLYMHDGQNLFDESTSGFGEWGVDEWMDSLIANGKPPCIIIGLENGPERMNEYNPFDNEKFGTGKGKLYVDFIVNTLKPFIDNKYRTLPGKENTIIAGSSMGGLISFYAMLEHPDVFGKAGIFSPAFWTSNSIYQTTDSLAHNLDGKLFFYAGEEEGKEYIDDMIRIENKVGKSSTAMLYSVVDTNGKHNEAAWRKWFGEFYCWIMASGFNRVSTNPD